MEEDYIKVRTEKLKKLRGAGVNPYPNRFDRTHTSIEFSKLKIGTKKVRIAGRLMLIRDMGKICFAHVRDESGNMQIAFNQRDVSKDEYKFFIKHFDIGDFIGVEGEVFKTKAGEKTILVKKFEMLTKALLPLPEKWHGLTDKEERYRKRYLDLLMNNEVRDVFQKRNVIVNALRSFFNKEGFVEVDTPVLQPLYGGGAAKPFRSELNSLGMDVYMAISKELYLKRLIVGGFEKIYELNKVFRNEGIDSTHNPEFTILETMWAYVDYTANMDLFEKMVEYVAKQTLKKTFLHYQGTKIELKRPWKRITMIDAIKKYAKIDVTTLSDKKLEMVLTKNKIKLPTGFRRGLAIEELFGELVQPKIVQPTIIYDYPSDTSPLAKKKISDTGIAERFEVIINGWEIGNNYSELNDPEDLKKTLSQQQEYKERGDDETAPYDEDFVYALQIGMPPTSGLGLGVDRLVMLLTDSVSIRDVILFPFMRPKND